MGALSCRAAGFAAPSCLASILFATPALAGAADISAADTAWMIVATALVLMMTIPGLALFYSGMVRKKNVLATMAQSLAAVAVVSILWVAFGYSLAFVGDGPWLGTLDRWFLAGMTMDSGVAARGATPLRRCNRRRPLPKHRAAARPLGTDQVGIFTLPR